MAKPAALRRRHQTASEVGEYRLDGEVGHHVAATMVAVVAARQRRRSGRPAAVSVRLHRVIWQRVASLSDDAVLTLLRHRNVLVGRCDARQAVAGAD